MLMYALGFDAKSAIPLNLIVSLVTLALSMLVGSRAVSAMAVLPFLPEIIVLAAGGIVSAFYGARLVQGLPSKHLVRVIAILLAGLGIMMLVEVARPFSYGGIVPAPPPLTSLISLGVVLSGQRYWRLGTVPTGRGVQRNAGAMSAGSIVGAVLGGLAISIAPVPLLKALLGWVLIPAAAKTVASLR
jgi:uncharacterized membrane protein YfcA